jgi:hypothetical protein
VGQDDDEDTAGFLMIGRRLALPPPRNLPWPLKPLQSAKTSLNYDAFGRMVMHIRHDLLKGISPNMVAWWFGNIAGDIEIEGARLNRYLAWHPLDHILWHLAQPGPDGCASVGAKFRIVEAFNRDPNFYIDIVDYGEAAGCDRNYPCRLQVRPASLASQS